MLESQPMLVTHLMRREVIAVAEQTSVRKAAQLLNDHEIRHLPVVDGPRLRGMVSEKDVLQFLAETQDVPSAAAKTSVSEIMNPEVVYVDNHETVRTAIGLMLEYQIGAVPVVDYESGELCGILSYVDILRIAQDLL